MDYSRESLDRIEKINLLKSANIIPYANHFHGKMDISAIRGVETTAIKSLEDLVDGAVGDYRTAGRIVGCRSFGKLVFLQLLDHTDRIQLCFEKGKFDFFTGRELISREGGVEIAGEMRSPFKILEKFVQTGDYIGVDGDLFYTKHGELTIYVREFQILSKAVRPLPEKFHGVTDQETIYRQRYLDLITNDESFKRMQFRSNFVKAVRDFYHIHDFIEVETPVLGNAASGAAAKPFITHHNDYGEDFFLRIAPETALKKTTVGRFERVFELSRNFRNEGSDPSHVQEYSEFEHYAAWWNFEDNVKFTEDMFDYIFDTMRLDRQIKIKDKEGVEKTVDFTTPWQRIDYIAGVQEKSGIDIAQYGPADESRLRQDIQQAGYTWEGIEKQATATMIDYLYKKVLRPGIIGPAFVYNYPKTMQPLARQSDANPNIVEQFQLVLNGWEVLKAYSELVDPKIQSENFDEQSGAIASGDDEATSGDDDFVLAMEHGMPCQSGWGMGVERIVALLTEQDNLRDVQLFPLMKSEKQKLSKSEQEKIYRAKKVVVIADPTQPTGVIANAIGQLGIEIGGHSKEKLFEAQTLFDADGQTHYTDCFYGMSNLAGSRDQMADFVGRCYTAGIQVFDFSDIMRRAHTDEDMQKGYREKKTNEIGYIAVGALIPADFEKDFLDSLQKF